MVTGASSGIGAATAQRLAEEGYQLVLLARNARRLEAVRESLVGEGHRVVACDLTDPAAIQAEIARLSGDFNGLDLLVNNAGMGYRARVEELEPELVRQVYATNVEAVLHTCCACLPLLRRGHRPVVVNVASVVGRRGVPGQAVYSSSKAALCSIGEALRVEWAPDGIAVCTLNPALTATGFFEAQPNPSSLPDPDLSASAAPRDVAQAILELDRRPRPERSLRWKWWLLGALSVLLPKRSDRLLVKRLGGDWRAPEWR